MEPDGAGDQPSPPPEQFLRPRGSAWRGPEPAGAPRPSWNPPSPAPQDSGPAEPARSDRSRLGEHPGLARHVRAPWARRQRPGRPAASGRPPPAPLPQDGPRPTGKKPAKPLRTPSASARADRGGPAPPARSYLPAAPELGPGAEGRTGSEMLRVTPDNGERPPARKLPT